MIIHTYVIHITWVSRMAGLISAPWSLRQCWARSPSSGPFPEALDIAKTPSDLKWTAIPFFLLHYHQKYGNDQLAQNITAITKFSIEPSPSSQGATLAFAPWRREGRPGAVSARSCMAFISEVTKFTSCSLVKHLCT